jgi:gamma-glutamylcyclotransferase (GGCT)/AIG2-like uncharacterized protein YtfP
MMTDQLFCYGTLCVPDIMRRVSGSLPASVASTLLNYACYELTGLDYPGIVPEKEARVSGVLYQGLSRAQLVKLDAYEGEQYRRVRVWISTEQEQRVQAWTYELQPRYYRRLTSRAWSLERFRRDQLPLYLHHSHNKLYGLHGRDPNQSA